MKIDEIRRARNQQPFSPFAIRIADGNEIKVTHPDAVAWGDESGPRMNFCLSGGEHHCIDMALASSLVFPEPASSLGSDGGD